MPKVQYPPTCFHCLLHIPNHPSLGPFLRPSLPTEPCPHLRSSLLAISHCFGGLESLTTCSLACTPAVRAWRPITPAFKTTALRSSTPTKVCSFGRTQPMSSVNSRTIYQCARNVRKGQSRISHWKFMLHFFFHKTY